MTLRRLRPTVPLVVPTVQGWWLLALVLALGVSWRLTDLGLMHSAAVLLACLAAVAALAALLLGAASRSLVRIAGPDQVVAGESGRWQAVLAPRIPPWVQGELRMRVGGLGVRLSLFAPPPGPTAPPPWATGAEGAAGAAPQPAPAWAAGAEGATGALGTAGALAGSAARGGCSAGREAAAAEGAEGSGEAEALSFGPSQLTAGPACEAGAVDVGPAAGAEGAAGASPQPAWD